MHAQGTHSDAMILSFRFYFYDGIDRWRRYSLLTEIVLISEEVVGKH